MAIAKQVCTDEIRAALLKIQGGKCPGCDQTLAGLAYGKGATLRVGAEVEHNPHTGRLRGIVCHEDNIRHRFIDQDHQVTTYDNLDRLLAYIEHPPADELPAELLDRAPVASGAHLNATLSKDIARTARAYAQVQGIPLSAVVEDALRQFFARQDAIEKLELMLAESGTDIVAFVASMEERRA